MFRRHRKAKLTILGAVIALAILGYFHARAMNWPLWHGEFCSLANGVTDGCDAAPATHYAYLVSALEYVVVVPLFAATLSFFTTSATAEHVHAAKEEIKTHVTDTSNTPC